MSRVIVAGGTIVTMDAARRVMVGDVVIEDGRIVSIEPAAASAHDATAQRHGANAQSPAADAERWCKRTIPWCKRTISRAERASGGANAQYHGANAQSGAGAATDRDADAQYIDARGCIVLPGLVQAHTHLCQTLCRGHADDLPLLEWLRQRVWPYEAALDERAMRAAARLACAELLLGGTTAILDMATVHETDALCDAVAGTGLRATIGKAMMDVGDGVPARLRETTRSSLDESDALRERWHGAADGRLRWAYAPRFVLSCTEALLREVAARVRGRRATAHARVGAAGRDRRRASRARRRQHRLPRVAGAGRAARGARALRPRDRRRARAARRRRARTSCTARRRT